MAELSSVDYAFLAILKAEDRKISNTEMDEIYHVRLVSRPFERLVGAGYISSDTKHRPYRHVITPDGLKVLAAELGIDEDHVDDGEKRTLREKQLWAGLVAFQRMLINRRRPNADAERPNGAVTAISGRAVDLDERIRSAYGSLTASAGEWVNLVAFRPLLPDVSKATLDKTLVRMLGAGDVRLEPEPLEQRLSVAERKAAIDVGGESCHLLAIGRP